MIDICSLQSEAGIIATALYNPKIILSNDKLKPKHFYDRTNACMYWAIQELQKSGVEEIDWFSLTNIIDSAPSIKSHIEKTTINDIKEFIVSCGSIVRPTIEEYNLLVDIVLSCSYKRDLYKKIQVLANSCQNPRNSIDDLQNQYYDIFSDLSNEYITGNDNRLYSEIIDQLWDEIESRQNGNGICGIPTIIPSLNKYFTYEKGELAILAALRKSGKSMFLLGELYNKITNGIPTVYLDSEMSSRLFTERLISHASKIPINIIKSGAYKNNKEQSDKIYTTIKELKKLPFAHIYRPRWDNESLVSISQLMKNKIDMQFLIFDYIKDVTGNDIGSRYIALGKMTNTLKNDIAGKMDIPVLSAAQLSRSEREDNLSIGNSFEIEQFASQIFNLIKKTNSEIQTDGIACGTHKLFVKCNRNGECMDNVKYDYIDLNFNGEICKFSEAIQHEEVDPF